MNETVDGLYGGTYSGVISGAGGLIMQGFGNRTLAGANTCTGGTTSSGAVLPEPATLCLLGLGGLVVLRVASCRLPEWRSTKAAIAAGRGAWQGSRRHVERLPILSPGLFAI